jgi:uncharacterized protein YecT (DUF1311 family)
MRMATMLRLAVVALACALQAVGLAQAQERQPSAKETAAVTACVKERANTEKAESCIYDLVAKPCLEADSGTTHGMADCFRVETAIWDTLLNEAYKALQDGLDAKQKTQLRDMQRAWIASRDRTCAFYWDKIQGTMAIPMGAECMLRETARRTLLLKVFADL